MAKGKSQRLYYFHIQAEAVPHTVDSRCTRVTGFVICLGLTRHRGEQVFASLTMKGCGFHRGQRCMLGNQSIGVMRRQEAQVELKGRFQCGCLIWLGKFKTTIWSSVPKDCRGHVYDLYCPRASVQMMGSTYVLKSWWKEPFRTFAGQITVVSITWFSVAQSAAHCCSFYALHLFPPWK